MESYRKFVLSFLIVLFAGLSGYFIFSAVKNPAIFNTAISVVFLFLLTIFNSILFAASSLHILLITHILIAAIVFWFFNYLGLSAVTAFAVAVIYFLLQIYGYLRVFYFEKDRLKIHWLAVFKSAWHAISLFLLFAAVFLIMTKFSADSLNEKILSDIIKSMEPVFSKFNLPSATSTIMELGEKQISKQELQQLQQFQKLGLKPPSVQELTKESVSSLNKQFNLNLKGNETIADAVAIYLKNIWNKLNDNIKLIIKVLLAVLIITTFQPVLWLLGIILGIIALPILKVFEKLHLYSKETEQAEKEKIIV